jgi:hypothetical protein
MIITLIILLHRVKLEQVWFNAIVGTAISVLLGLIALNRYKEHKKPKNIAEASDKEVKNHERKQMIMFMAAFITHIAILTVIGT